MANQIINTGYKAWRKLKKVVNGGPFDGQPLDANNMLCSVTGLPQATKDNNSGDPDYVDKVYDTTSCPLGPVTFKKTVLLADSTTITSCSQFSGTTDAYCRDPDMGEGAFLYYDKELTQPIASKTIGIRVTDDPQYPDSYIVYRSTDATGKITFYYSIVCHNG